MLSELGYQSFDYIRNITQIIYENRDSIIQILENIKNDVSTIYSEDRQKKYYFFDHLGLNIGERELTKML
ncbi:MAG: hypothetical protein HC906_05095 [Bacteroidales bacterium]|nr:hypothetical protein [Bacteroidales bacterium]